MSHENLTKIIMDWSALFTRLSMHDINRYARTTGLSFGQMNVLLHLYYRGPSEVMTFTELMQASPAAASQMVERMVQQGIVQRMESSTDRRVRVVHLTDQGRKIVEGSLAARQTWVDSLMASLTPEQKGSIAQALTTLTEKAAQLESGESIPDHKS